MKKKITLVATSVLLVAAMVIGGTLAYFTDTDSATNEFTMGNVSIDLIEQQFDKETGALEDFDQNKQLMPGDKNKQDKIVTIKNDGSNDAWVWYEWYIPAALDAIDGKTGLNNVLHVNSYGATWDIYADKGYTLPAVFAGDAYATGKWDHDPVTELGLTPGPEGYVGQVTKDGIVYHKYIAVYKEKLAPGKITPPAMNGVYLDADLDFADGKYTCHGVDVDYDFTKNIKIYVDAFAVQAEGLNSVYDAYKAYYAQ